MRVTRRDPYRVVELADGTDVSCYAVVIASGMEVRQLDVPGLEERVGAGVYYGSALSEAILYRDKDVVVVGAANSVGQGAMAFSRYARTVTVLMRGPDLRRSMSQYLVDRINETANIIVLPNTVVEGVGGTGRLEFVNVRHTDTNESRVLSAAAMFIFIGSAPRTAMVSGLVELDAHGYVLTGREVMHGGRRPKGGRPTGTRSCSRRACQACSPSATLAEDRASAWRLPLAKGPRRSARCTSTSAPCDPASTRNSLFEFPGRRHSVLSAVVDAASMRAWSSDRASEVAIQPRQHLASHIVDRQGVSAVDNRVSLLPPGGSEQCEQRTLRCLDGTFEIVPAVEHQRRRHDPRRVVHRIDFRRHMVEEAGPL